MAYNPLQDLKSAGALLEGHFLLSSGLHSNRYVQCACYLQHPHLAERAGRALAVRLFSSHSHFSVSAVVSPALGGLIIGHEVGRALDVRAMFTERCDGEMTLRRGFSLNPGERVLIVEDVVTTGKSGREVIELVRRLGAEPLAMACIVDRREDRKQDLGLPLVSLTNLDIENWRPEHCPLCKAGGEAVKPGSRASTPL